MNTWETTSWKEVTDESVIPEGVAIQEYGIIGARTGLAVDKIDDNNIVFENYTNVPGTEYSLHSIEYPVSKAPQGSKSDTAT